MGQLNHQLGITALRTSPYHPQTDGLVERFNQTLKNMLQKFVADTGCDWDKWLPFVLFAYGEGYVFLEALPNNMWWCRCCLIIPWPWNTTFFWNSPAVIFEESLASQTFLLTMHLEDIDTCPLPGIFTKFSVDWKFLIIGLMVEMLKFPPSNPLSPR